MKRIHTLLTPLYCYIAIAIVTTGINLLVNQVITRLVPTNFPATTTDISNVSGMFIGALICFCSFLFPLRRRPSPEALSPRTLALRFWGPLLLGFVFLAHTLGQAVIVFNHLEHVTTFPSWSDACFLGEYPLLLLLLFLLPTRSLSRAATIRTILDVLIVLMTLLVFSWSFFLGPLMLQSQHSWLQGLVSAAYPFGNLLLLCCFLFFSARSVDPWLRIVKWLLLLGLLFLAVGDVENEFSTLLNNSSYDFILTIAWSIAYTVLGLTAYFMRFIRTTSGAAKEASPTQETKLAPLWLSLLPYTLIPIVLLLLFSTWNNVVDGVNLLRGVFAGVIALFVLILLRQVLTLSEIRSYAHLLHRANARLSSLAITDPLTDVPNHRALAATLSQELARTRRYARPCSLLFLDIDHFKALNDGYGHATGDVLLQEFARLLRSTIRTCDTVGRWGGEEFLVLMPETATEDALEAAERIRTAVSHHTFAIGGGLHFTCTIGVASYPEHAHSQQTLIHAADQAMYGAKRLGRNQVRVIDDPAVEALLAGGAAEEGREDVALRGTVEALALLVEKRDASLGRHGQQVADLLFHLAGALQLSATEAQMLALAGQLHDIGKIGIPDALLQKEGSLTHEEWKQMQAAPAAGAEVINYIPSLRPLAPVIRAQHEHWDGQGYPDRLSRENIPLGARLLAIADAYVVMINGRPYLPARSPAEAIAELRRCSGTQFDPRLVEALVDLLRSQQKQRLAEAVLS